jgi:hypothetical protein
MLLPAGSMAKDTSDSPWCAVWALSGTVAADTKSSPSGRRTTQSVSTAANSA